MAKKSENTEEKKLSVEEAFSEIEKTIDSVYSEPERTVVRNAINKGIQYTKEHSSKELASIIIKQFPNTNESDLEKYIDNYKKNDSWLENTIIKEEIYKNLQDLMIENNLLDTYVPYNQLINNE